MVEVPRYACKENLNQWHCRRRGGQLEICQANALIFKKGVRVCYSP
jgi:putative hemolysin